MKKQTKEAIKDYAWATLGFILGVLVPALAIAVSSLVMDGKL